ncbi:hypothetical protein BCE75_101357 [Isoptericola sp. CG 20/1183]|uniref:Lipoprotein n=1 Tax=Isoptericola halotolerans TaxID=300560 RepID=A0ABX5EIG6_9MICO|nr:MULTISPECIES: hypothetical protein [Isoptericola]MCK0117299.1 hypothetical protein [Isoptericola sp. S6320L]PRZ08523.1 hypothetical protein BCL65_10265 [Isoptericola halotolerans]PRZ11030.1 hypothetical protein BCE75_101357 [Isoptericola sp. CG 20/1183]
MRPLAAAAALSAVLLLAACAQPGSGGPAAESPTAAAGPAEAESVDVAATCRAYHVGGSQSINKRVKRWTSAVAYPATAENSVELTTIRDRLEGQILDAQPGPASILEAVREPFATSLAGGSADPADVESAADVVKRMCADAGYRS